MTTLLKTKLEKAFTLLQSQSLFCSELQTIETLIVPVLEGIFWSYLSDANSEINLVRTGATKDFDLLVLKPKQRIIIAAVECKKLSVKRVDSKPNNPRESPSNDSFAEQVIRYKTESRLVKKHNFDISNASILWTNGWEWIVVKSNAFSETRDKIAISDAFKLMGDDFDSYFEYFKFDPSNEDEWGQQFSALKTVLLPQANR